MLPEVIWSDDALIQAEQIVGYLKLNFREIEVSKFFALIKKFEHLVQTFPKLFPESQLIPFVRQAVMNSVLTIYYVYQSETIFVVTMTDSRVDPATLQNRF